MNLYKINRRFGILTISSVFLLLIAGGVVRSTGSGMGCPDWPKCYGLLMPPTCSCQLPYNYKEIFTQKRIQKAEKFAKLLNSIGLESQAEKLLNDPELHKDEEFNVYKAWTEYINRIIGVLSGLFSLVFFISLLKIKKSISGFRFWSGVFGFVMMLFNAWLGSIVVATNLFPIMISIHYIAAYAVLAFFMFSITESALSDENKALSKFKWYYLTFALLSLVQVIYGTQLREVSDRGLKQGFLYSSEGINFAFLGTVFKSHWFLAVILILAGFVPVYQLRQKISKNMLKLLIAVPLVLLIQYISGVLNLRYGFPMLAQVSHIFFAGIIFGITLYICTVIFKTEKRLG
jgi:heme a synthase